MPGHMTDPSDRPNPKANPGTDTVEGNQVTPGGVGRQTVRRVQSRRHKAATSGAGAHPVGQASRLPGATQRRELFLAQLRRQAAFGDAGAA